jgi:hypothetical protein
MPLHSEAGSAMAQAVSRWHLTAEVRFLLYDEQKMKLSSNEGDSGKKNNTNEVALMMESGRVWIVESGGRFCVSRCLASVAMDTISH